MNKNVTTYKFSLGIPVAEALKNRIRLVGERGPNCTKKTSGKCYLSLLAIGFAIGFAIGALWAMNWK